MDLYEYQRSRSFIDIGPRPLRFIIFKLLFLRNRYVDWSIGERKFVQMVQLTWPRWPPYGKNMKNSSSLEPKGWWPWKFVASSAQVLPSLFKQWPWVDLDPFYDSVKFGPLWYKSWYMQSTKWVHETLWVPKVKVIDWSWSKSLRINIFKLFFLNNLWGDWSQISCGASMGWETMFKWSRSHDKTGRHAHIWWKSLKIFFSGI